MRVRVTEKMKKKMAEIKSAMRIVAMSPDFLLPIKIGDEEFNGKQRAVFKKYEGCCGDIINIDSDHVNNNNIQEFIRQEYLEVVE